MSKYNPQKHNRRSIRLKGYDYAQKGLYFVTICVQKRVCLFGYIKNGEMFLNPAGKMIQKWYLALETKFPDIKCGEYIIMPNHFHCIIQNVGSDQSVCPKPGDQRVGEKKHPMQGEHIGSPLHRVIQWFKTMTTNEYIRNVKHANWQRFDGKLWQRNYWEHIIRDQQSFKNISKYIINNPNKWELDKFNNKNI
ncbi:MAG: transposase [Flavobacteriales bacterium]